MAMWTQGKTFPTWSGSMTWWTCSFTSDLKFVYDFKSSEVMVESGFTYILTLPSMVSDLKSLMAIILMCLTLVGLSDFLVGFPSRSLQAPEPWFSSGQASIQAKAGCRNRRYSFSLRSQLCSSGNSRMKSISLISLSLFIGTKILIDCAKLLPKLIFRSNIN